MAQECPLTAPLTVKDIQNGVAGKTGTVWTIAPDCSFTVAQQVGSKTTEPYSKGRLTPQQQTRLKQLLAQAAIANMPAQLGDGPQVNARQVTLSYGGKVSVLTLPPGGDDLGTLRAMVGDDPARRLLELAEMVKDMAGS